MNEQTEQLIRELAEKLGTTVEHLWGVLIKQAPITAAADTIITLIMLVTLWVGSKLVYKKTKVPPKTEENRFPKAEWDDDFVEFMAWGALALHAIATFAALYFTIATVLTVVLNPEYWALKQLLP